jgi:dienelactone hydrolase
LTLFGRYCLGGAQGCTLAGTDLVDAAVIAHPASLNKDPFDKINVPISFIAQKVQFVTLATPTWK